jgi:hypothetical protein
MFPLSSCSKKEQLTLLGLKSLSAFNPPPTTKKTYAAKSYKAPQGLLVTAAMLYYFPKTNLSQTFRLVAIL